MLLTFKDNSLINYMKVFVVNLCARSVESYIEDAEVIDGRMVIICESNNGIPIVDWKLTQEAVSLSQKGKRLIIGYISYCLQRKLT